MRDRRLEDLLRDPRVHGSAPEPAELRALQEAVLTRLAAERLIAAVPERRQPIQIWVERSALAAAAVVSIVALADWLGGLWWETDLVIRDSMPAAPNGGWVKAATEIMVAQPLVSTAILAGLACLLLPPVRQTLIQELR